MITPIGQNKYRINMLPVLFFLVLGIITGVALHKLRSFEPILQKLISVVIYLLLFTLGLNAGLNKAITSQIHTLGLTAFLISAFAMAGSVGVAWLTYNLFFKTKSDEK